MERSINEDRSKIWMSVEEAKAWEEHYNNCMWGYMKGKVHMKEEPLVKGYTEQDLENELYIKSIDPNEFIVI